MTLENCSPEMKHAVENITKFFTGYDGSIGFVRFLRAIELMESDESKLILRDVVLDFNKLLEAINGGPIEQA